MIICIHKNSENNYKVKVYTGSDILYYDAKEVIVVPETLITDFDELVIDAESFEIKGDHAIILRK